MASYILFAFMMLAPLPSSLGERDENDNEQESSHSEVSIHAHESTGHDYVCCLKAIEPFNALAYHVDSSKDEIKHCLMILMSGGGHEKNCTTEIEKHPKYHEFLVKAAQNALVPIAGKERAAAEAKTAAITAVGNTKQKAQQDIKNTKQKAQQDIKAAEDQQAQAEATLASWKQQLEKQEKVVQQKQEAKKAAEGAYDGGAHGPPKACNKDGVGQDCCCSFKGSQGQHVPVLVKGDTFQEWEMCKGALAYSETSFWDGKLGCDYFKDCGRCRAKICSDGGKGKCPTEFRT